MEDELNLIERELEDVQGKLKVLYEVLNDLRSEETRLKNRRSALIGSSLLRLKGWELRTGHSYKTFFAGQREDEFKFLICSKECQKIDIAGREYDGVPRINFHDLSFIEEKYFKEYGIYGWGATEDEAIAKAIDNMVLVDKY